MDRHNYGRLLSSISLIAFPAIGIFLAWGQGFLWCSVAALLGLAVSGALIKRVFKFWIGSSEKGELERSLPTSAKERTGPPCKFCGSMIDHFGFTAADMRITMSVSVQGGGGSQESFMAMMRSVGGRCTVCNAVCCAKCYSDHERKCPTCANKISAFQ